MMFIKRLLISIVLSIIATTFAVAAVADTLTVSAASSLTNAFKEIGRAFEAQHPGSKIEFNFAASGALLRQIEQGAPVDVFAAADQETMDRAEAKGLIDKKTRDNFIANGLVLIIPADSPLTIGSLQDLTDKRIERIAIGNPATTPAGRYARTELQRTGIWQAVEAKCVLAENVRQSLSYVERGEVDTGFVFASDTRQEGSKIKIAVAIELPERPIYPIAKTVHSQNPLAADFIQFVQSADGLTVLIEHGFLPLR